MPIYNDAIKMDQLNDVPLFQGISPKNREVLLRCLHSYTKFYKKGAFLLFEDEQIDFVGIILSGTADIVYENMWGDKYILGSLGKGDMFGEDVVFGADCEARVAVQARDQTVTLYVSSHLLLEACKKNDSAQYCLMSNLLLSLAKKNKQLILKLRILSEKSLRKKLMSFLLYQAKVEGKNTIVLPFTHTALAHYLCTNRTALLRVINTLKQEGIIDFQRNKFTLLHSELVK